MSRAAFDRRDLVAIAAGGITGALLRWWITGTGFGPIGDDHWLHHTTDGTLLEPAIAWRTLLANLLGTAVLGLTLALRRAQPERRLTWLAVGTGFCGSLTTFSTLAFELATRFRGGVGPQGHVTTGTDMTGFRPVDGSAQLIDYAWGLTPVAAGIAYLVVTLVAGAIAFAGGRGIGRLVTASNLPATSPPPTEGSNP